MTALVPDLPKTEIAIVEMTNAFRAENKLGAVTPNAKLAAAARVYAQFLAKSDLFSHTADGRQPADRIKSAGYTYCSVGENLALNLDSRGFETRQLAREAVEGWKGSPPHRKTMLEPAVTEIGVGIAKSTREEKYLSVQLFGRPDSLKYEFRIDNLSAATVAYKFGSEALELKPSTAVRHTACLPGTIEITGGKSANGKPIAITGRYEARNGDHYSIRPAAGGTGVTIEVKPAERPAAVK